MVESHHIWLSDVEKLIWPAVVGCGEILFEKIKIAKRISIDCKNEKINVIEYSKKGRLFGRKKTSQSTRLHKVEYNIKK